MKHCLDCKQPAAWIRHTQFAGDHPFCDEHARVEADFGVSDSTKDWTQVGVAAQDSKEKT